MNNEELKEVMTSGEPVEYRGTTYSHISAIIYRPNDKGMFIQVELMDKTKNCVVIARPTEVEKLEAK